MSVVYASKPSSFPKRRRALRSLAIPALLALGAPILQYSPIAHAQPAMAWYVAPGGSDLNSCTSAASPCATVSHAVGLAGAGDTIMVAMSGAQPYTDNIDVNKNLTIVGGNPQVSALTVIHGAANGGPVLKVEPGANVTVQGITLTGGTGFIDLSGNVYGGGVYNQGTLLLEDTTTTGNSVTPTTGRYAEGGGIYSVGSNGSPASLTVQYSFVMGNTASAAGVGGIGYGSGHGLGGGIYNDQFSTLTVTCSSVLNNTAGNSGTAIAHGGGIYNADRSGNSLVINVTIDGNTATGSYSTHGGGIYNDWNSGAFLTLNDDTLSHNAATGLTGSDGEGGGLYVSSGTVTANNTTFADNTASSANNTARGGGVYVNSGNGKAVFNNATIGYNAASGTSAFGGGVAFGDGSTNSGAMTNTLLADNTTTTSGITLSKPGAVARAGAATVTANNCNPAVGIDNGGNIDDDGSCGFTNPASVSNSKGIGLMNMPATYFGQGNNGGANNTLAIPLTSTAAGLGLAATCEALTGPDPAPFGTPNADVDERGLPRHAVTRGKCDSGAYDTGGKITLPSTTVGATALTGPMGRLGFAASTDPKFNVGYITFQQGASSFVVRQVVAVACWDQCAGTPLTPVPGTATLTLTGTVFSAYGTLAKIGDQVQVVETIVTTFNPASFSYTQTITSVVVMLNGKTLATYTAPLLPIGKVIYTALNEPSAP